MSGGDMLNSRPVVRLGSSSGRAEAFEIAEDLYPYNSVDALRLWHLIGLAEKAPLARRLQYGEAWQGGFPIPEEIEEWKTEIREGWPEKLKDSEVAE